MYIANAESNYVSDKDPEKIVIQQNPEIDNIVVDPTPIPLLLQVLQSQALTVIHALHQRVMAEHYLNHVLMI